MFVRAVTLLARRQGADVPKKILKQTILAANNGHERSVAVYKISAAVDTKKQCYDVPVSSIFHSICIWDSFRAGFTTRYSPYVNTRTIACCEIRLTRGFQPW